METTWLGWVFPMMVAYIILDNYAEIHLCRKTIKFIRHAAWRISKPDIPKLMRKAGKDYLKCLECDEDFEKKRKAYKSVLDDDDRQTWYEEDCYRTEAINQIKELVKDEEFNKGLLYLQVAKYLYGHNKPLTLYEITIACESYSVNPQDIFNIFFKIHQINKFQPCYEDIAPHKANLTSKRCNLQNARIVAIGQQTLKNYINHNGTLYVDEFFLPILMNHKDEFERHILNLMAQEYKYRK